MKPTNVLVDLDVSCKRGVFKKMAMHAAQTMNINSCDLVDLLLEREQIGTTGIGHGVAVPHARLGVDGLGAVLAKLKSPIEFDSVDDQPVDLVFLLLAPEAASAEHLKALSRIARLVRAEEVRTSMRGATDAEALYEIAVGNAEARAA